MRAKKCIAASILFGILMIGLTICTSAKVKIKENGEYRYRVLNQRSGEMGGRGTEFGIYDGIEQGISLDQYLGTEAEVEIPEEIDGLPVVYVGARCFENNEKLQKVTIPESVRWVDGFGGCTNLRAVLMADGICVIGRDCFVNCTSLEKIDMPDSVRFIGGLERYCSSFDGCTSLKEIRFSKNLERIDTAAFAHCTSLEKVSLPEKLGYIPESCFEVCTSLKNVEIPDNYQSIRSGAFYGCSALKTIRLPEQLNYIGSLAFADCTSLTEVALPDKVKTIGERTFKNCYSLKKIKLPKGLKTIGVNAFRGSGLKGITIPGEVTKIERCAFARCASMKKIVLKGKNTKISPKAFKGINKDAVFQVPRGMVRIYYSRLTKRNTGFNPKSMKLM